ncbi:hypothetical protein [Caballeronia sp. dw_276]|uniref:alpha/beta hydrolase n=1 Tax=Caballeronia sp. dw_276 TaxID=2719795 RepID=UPI001BD2ACB3|nr:hypothetical protein [Caballeronia sp. dw_276]
MTEEICFLAAHNDEQARLRIYRPANSRGSACVLINSGRVARFDEDEDESKLYQALHYALCERGITTFEIDLPERDRSEPDSTEKAVEDRLLRLRCLLDEPAFLPFHYDYSVVALSLGGQVMLRQLAGPEGRPAPGTVVLIGTVVEAPVIVVDSVRKIHLVYGENDCVGYLEPQSEYVRFQRPVVYGQRSRERLVVRRSQHVSCHILKGCGHTLSRVDPGCDDPLNALVSFLLPVAGFA